ncbi:transketolase, partial [Francisella tularensis subsp. holarctica]|nr:transketolase [Francisella tularensis subsp. holarctica]
GWHVIENVDVNVFVAIEKAINEAHSHQQKPTLICCKTVIGFGSPEKDGTASVHGSPLSDQERASAAKELNRDYQAFQINQY